MTEQQFTALQRAILALEYAETGELTYREIIPGKYIITRNGLEFGVYDALRNTFEE